MASFVTYLGNGTIRDFAVPFPFLRREDVTLTVNDAPVTYSWVNDSLLRCATAPANATRVEVKRVTPYGVPRVTWTDGANLQAADLSTDSRQALYAVEEARDAIDRSTADLTTKINAALITGGGLPAVGAGNVGRVLAATGATTYGWSASLVVEPGTGRLRLPSGAFLDGSRIELYGASQYLQGTAGGAFFQGAEGTRVSYAGAEWQMTINNATALRVTNSLVEARGSLKCLGPRPGSAGGNAMVDRLNRFGAWAWADTGGYVEIEIDGQFKGITTFGSDERMKDDIAPATLRALEDIRALDFVDYRYKALPGAPEGTEMPLLRGGVIAQQVQALRPEWVHTTGDGLLHLNAHLLLTAALQAIKELAAEVDALKAARG